MVFLTGATGFIGSHVLRELRAAGHPVRALVRSRDAKLDAEIVVGDLNATGALARAMDGCRYLVHCAALYSFAPHARSQMHRVNVLGTAGLLEAARIAGVERAVVTSSSATVGPERDGKPATEEDHAHDMRASAYHHSKVEQERAAIAARVPAVLLLPSAPIGPGDAKPTPTGRLVLDFARGRIGIAPPGRGGMNLVAVEDVARAHVAALERGEPRERYLIGGENLTLDEVWALLAQASGRAAPRMRLPYGAALAAGWLDELRCRYVQPHCEPWVPLEGVRMSRERMFVDSSRAQRELGHTPTPVRDAIERAIVWYRTHGYVA
ncbi:MAG TPA: NAD-dependent epimerase/dehydratase family protein [Candidatus Tyrphobacter sp.]